MYDELSIASFFDLKEIPWMPLFEEIDYPWQALERLSSFLSYYKKRIEVPIPAGVYLVNEEQIFIGKGTVIEPGAFISGPCFIGPNCQIRHGAYIRGHVITGSHCIIGHDTEIKHSILLNGVRAAHFNYVGNSILGNRVNLGAGVKCANLRLDCKEVAIHFEGKKLLTGLKKLGAIIGDEAQIGCNVVTNPGTLIGKGTICYPCLNIGGIIHPFTKVSIHDNASSC